MVAVEFQAVHGPVILDLLRHGVVRVALLGLDCPVRHPVGVSLGLALDELHEHAAHFQDELLQALAQLRGGTADCLAHLPADVGEMGVALHVAVEEAGHVGRFHVEDFRRELLLDALAELREVGPQLLAVHGVVVVPGLTGTLDLAREADLGVKVNDVLLVILVLLDADRVAGIAVHVVAETDAAVGKPEPEELQPVAHRDFLFRDGDVLVGVAFVLHDAREREELLVDAAPVVFQPADRHRMVVGDHLVGTTEQVLALVADHAVVSGHHEVHAGLLEVEQLALVRGVVETDDVGVFDLAGCRVHAEDEVSRLDVGKQLPAFVGEHLGI